MTDRKLLERIKRGEGLPPIPLKDDECNRHENGGRRHRMKPEESLWYDAGYKTAKKETIDKMLEITDNAMFVPPSVEESVVWNRACRYIQAKIVTEMKGGNEK